MSARKEKHLANPALAGPRAFQALNSALGAKKNMLAIAEFQKQEGTKTGGYFYLGRKKKKRQFKAPD